MNMRRPVWLRSRLSGKSQSELDPAGGLPASPSPDMGLPEPGATEPSAAEPAIDELQAATAAAVESAGRSAPAEDLALAEPPKAEARGALGQSRGTAGVVTPERSAAGI
ncbi:MAG TPA: hypothetical protein VGI58_08500 [Streptosporangiaceae bacterium]